MYVWTQWRHRQQALSAVNYYTDNDDMCTGKVVCWSSKHHLRQPSCLLLVLPHSPGGAFFQAATGNYLQVECLQSSKYNHNNALIHTSSQRCNTYLLYHKHKWFLHYQINKDWYICSLPQHDKRLGTTWPDAGQAIRWRNEYCFCCLHRYQSTVKLTFIHIKTLIDRWASWERDYFWAFIWSIWIDGGVVPLLNRVMYKTFICESSCTLGTTTG